jgi:hypothetical protein
VTVRDVVTVGDTDGVMVGEGVTVTVRDVVTVGDTDGVMVAVPDVVTVRDGDGVIVVDRVRDLVTVDDALELRLTVGDGVGDG